MPTVVLASRNQKKVRELAALLEPYNIQLRAAAEFPEAPEVEETGATFAENAALKAAITARAVGQWSLADDSGLAVDALDGAPGVHSARFAGPAATDADNNAKLILELLAVPAVQRTASFHCHLAVADPTGAIRISVDGQCHGLIIDQPRGSEGFGYDPHFLVPEYGKTFAELSLALKSQISHRANAFRELIPQLVALLG